MSEVVWAALITGVFSFLAQWVLSKSNRDKLYEKMDKDTALADATIRAELAQHQAVTDTKIEELTREVREHNQFATRIPVIEEQIKVANHRIDDLERKGA